MPETGVQTGEMVCAYTRSRPVGVIAGAAAIAWGRHGRRVATAKPHRWFRQTCLSR